MKYLSELNTTDPVTYKLTGSSFKIKDRGIVYSAELTCCVHRDRLMELIGTEIVGTEIVGKSNLGTIIGVESFCVMRQCYSKIGLMIKVDAPEGRTQEYKTTKPSEPKS